MTNRDEAIFSEAFEKMEAKGYFNEIRAKIKAERQVKSSTRPAARVVSKTKPIVSKGSKKSRQKIPTSSSSQITAKRTPIAASKK
jgi:hypothetical protein